MKNQERYLGSANSCKTEYSRLYFIMNDAFHPVVDFLNGSHLQKISPHRAEYIQELQPNKLIPHVNPGIKVWCRNQDGVDKTHQRSLVRCGLSLFEFIDD